MRQKASQANRGMSFEMLIDRSNEMYEQKDIAIINKRPTPIRVTGRNRRGEVTGFFEKPSTVDYDGTYRGKSIVFEAKQVMKLLRRFDLDNIHPHQVEYLAKCHRHGAISFLLIEFVSIQEILLVPYQTLQHYWDAAMKGGRKSIPLDELEVYAYRVKGGSVPVDYLKVVDQVWKLDAA